MIGPMKSREKGLRPLGHRSVEMHFDVCLQQKRLCRVGVWLKDAGRGLQNRRDRVIADIHVIGKSKTYRAKNKGDVL
jgi:hypothetical protein